MPYIVIIDKAGIIKETNIKEYNSSELYKKANFKSAEGFRLEHKWIIGTNQQIAIYGKKNGKAGQENKYDFPPPIDNVLFFGGCVLVSECIVEPNKIKDLRITEWKSIYEKLMGGFEDLKDTDEEAEDEEEEEDLEEPNEYVCDDFLVEDDDIDYDDLSAQEEEEEEEDKIISKKKKNGKKKDKKKDKKEKIGDLSIIMTSTSNDNTFLDCQSELEEEEYFA